MAKKKFNNKKNQKGNKSNGKKSDSTQDGRIFKFAPNSTDQATKYAPFESIKELICLKIKKDLTHGGDMAHAIETGSYPDWDDMIPTKPIMDQKDEYGKTIVYLDKEGKIMTESERKATLDTKVYWWKQNVEALVTRSQKCRDNKIKTYAMIIDDYCTPGMKSSLESQKDYHKFRDDPVALLPVIRSLIQTNKGSLHPCRTAATALRQWLTARQRDDEELVEFIKRRKQLGDVVLSRFPKEIFNQVIEEVSDFRSLTDQAEKDSRLASSFDEMAAVIAMDSVNQDSTVR